jgi:hypothetical protein
MTQAPCTVGEQLAAAAAKCREALADPKFAGLNERLPGAPRDAEGWFALLGGYPHDGESYASMVRMVAALPADAAAAGVKVEHYAVLQALTVAAPRMNAEPVPNSVKRLYATLCCEIAARAKHWESHLDIGSWRFNDVAHLASLRRFPAGEVGVQFWPRLSLFYPLRIHPFDLVGFLCEVAFAVRGIGPVASLHFNYARANSLVMPQIEFERSLWRIAKTLEYHPRVKALTSNSWFHSPRVAETFPRLAWMRDVFTNGGAYAVDLEPGHAADIGYNSVKRKQLHDEGKFCPRQTLIIWPREDLLSWAASHPEFADEGETPPAAPEPKRWRIRIKPPGPSRAAKRNSPIMLWDGIAAYSRGAAKYVFLVLVLPALAVAVVAGLGFGWLAAVPAFAIGLAAAYIVQYFFSQ